MCECICDIVIGIEFRVVDNIWVKGKIDVIWVYIVFVVNDRMIDVL